MRIFIYGAPGSGKSTLAKRIAAQFEIPLIELDDVLWSKKFTVKRTYDECRVLLSKRIAAPSWVVEGCSSRWTEEAVDAADFFVVLNPSRAVAVYRATKRHLSRRKENAGENLRSLFTVWWYAWNFHKPGHELAERKKKLYAHRSFIVLKDERDIQRFLKTLSERS
jgi:adenylate kinase family enzyme